MNLGQYYHRPAAQKGLAAGGFGMRSVPGGRAAQLPAAARSHRRRLPTPDGQHEHRTDKTREHIAQTRACCKALGKDVKRYRNSAEALNRRVLQGKGLYQINNVVEVNNLLSLDTGYSLGSYDLEKLEGDIVWKPAGEGVHYQGIGKEAVNIEFLPVLSDRQGFFGNPNSDSTRAMITPQTTQLLMCVFGFGGAQPLQPMLEQMCDALQTYCQATELETAVIV